MGNNIRSGHVSCNPETSGQNLVGIFSKSSLSETTRLCRKNLNLQGFQNLVGVGKRKVLPRE